MLGGEEAVDDVLEVRGEGLAPLEELPQRVRRRLQVRHVGPWGGGGEWERGGGGGCSALSPLHRIQG